MPTRKPLAPAKRAANHANARKSTGPRTPAGKQASRKNALKHGLLAKECVITDGDGCEAKHLFDRILDALIREHQPVGLIEETLTERIAQIYWRLRRAQRYEIGALRRNLDELDLPPHLAAQDDGQPIPVESACTDPDDIRHEIEESRADRARLDRARNALAHPPLDLADQRTFDACHPLLKPILKSRNIEIPDFNPNSVFNPYIRCKRESQAGKPSGDKPVPTTGRSLLESLADLPTHAEMAAAHRRHHIVVLAECGIEGEDLERELTDTLNGMIQEADRRLTQLQSDLDEANRYDTLRRDRRRYVGALPDHETMMQLIRYENMLDRQLHRAIKELASRQRRRLSQAEEGEDGDED